MAKTQKEKVNPDQVVLNPIQQKRLASIADIDAKEISGKNIGQLSDTLKWRVQPHIFRCFKYRYK